jgi:predicted Zn-dependent peptidase
MYQRTVLPNGLRVITTTMPHTQSVSMAIFIGAGSRYESDELAGISHFLEHLPFKGTKLWPTAQRVSEAIEGVGGILNASTDREATIYWCKVAKPHFVRSLSVLMDMVLNPLLDPEEVEKEREVVLEELRMSNDQPGYRADLLMDEVLWPDQAMGRDIGGSPDTVRAILQTDIHEYMARQYTPSNTVVAVAGSISHEEVVDHLTQSLGSWPQGDAQTWYPVENSNFHPKVKFERRKTDQAYLCVGLPGLSLNHCDRRVMSLMNTILGEGMSSRLFLELRENQSLAYDIHSSASFYRDCGALVVYSAVEPVKYHRAIAGIIEQLSSLRDGVEEWELDKARELSKGRLLLRMEDSRNAAMWIGAQELLQGQVRTIEDVVEELDAVTTSDIKRLACELITEDRLCMSIVGPYRSNSPFHKLLKF